MKKNITLSACVGLAICLAGCGKSSKKNESDGLSVPGSHIQIVSIQNGGGLKDEGFKAAADALQSHPDIRGIFAINDPSALGAHAALKQKAKVGQVTIVGFDGQLDGKQAIKDGWIFADPIQHPDQMGREIVKLIVKYQAGEDFDQEILIPATLYDKAEADTDPELK